MGGWVGGWVGGWWVGFEVHRAGEGGGGKGGSALRQASTMATPTGGHCCCPLSTSTRGLLPSHALPPAFPPPALPFRPHAPLPTVASVQRLCDQGFSASDIITILFRVVRNHNTLPEFLKLEYIKVCVCVWGGRCCWGLRYGGTLYMVHPVAVLPLPLDTASPTASQTHLPCAWWCACVPAANRLLPHAHQRGCELAAAAVWAAGRDVQGVSKEHGLIHEGAGLLVLMRLRLVEATQHGRSRAMTSCREGVGVNAAQGSMEITRENQSVWMSMQ